MLNRLLFLAVFLYLAAAAESLENDVHLGDGFCPVCMSKDMLKLLGSGDYYRAIVPPGSPECLYTAPKKSMFCEYGCFSLTARNDDGPHMALGCNEDLILGPHDYVLSTPGVNDVHFHKSNRTDTVYILRTTNATVHMTTPEDPLLEEWHLDLVLHDEIHMKPIFGFEFFCAVYVLLYMSAAAIGLFVYFSKVKIVRVDNRFISVFRGGTLV